MPLDSLRLTRRVDRPAHIGEVKARWLCLVGRGRGLTVLVVSLPGILTPYGLAAFPAALAAEAGTEVLVE